MNIYSALLRAETERKHMVQHDLPSISIDGTAAVQRAPIIAGYIRRRREIHSPEIVALVQRAFLLPRDFSPRCLVFTQLDKNWSREPVCARAAEALSAQVDGSVCVVDANFWMPAMHEYFSASNELGFSNALVESGPIESYAQFVEGQSFAVITAGSEVAERHSLLASNAVRVRIEELRARFDYVLIDAPPATAINSAIVLGKLTDGVIVLVEANQTRRETAKNAIDQFKSAGVHVVGTVLNNRRFPIPEALYNKL